MFEILEGGKQPTRATKYSACVDLYAREDVTLYAGETKIIPLGVKIDLNLIKKDFIEDFYDSDSFNEQAFNTFMQRHYLALHIRSGLAAKGLVQNNGVGIIDLDYPNEIGLIVSFPYNDVKQWSNGFISGNDQTFNIKAGERVAQCTLIEHKGYIMGIDSENERQGGFGSTGAQ